MFNNKALALIPNSTVGDKSCIKYARQLEMQVGKDVAFGCVEELFLYHFRRRLRFSSVRSGCRFTAYNIIIGSVCSIYIDRKLFTSD